MKRLYWFAFAAFLTLFARPTHAELFVGEFNGDNLIRRQVTIANGQFVTVQTLDCGPGEDTAIFLLEGTFIGSDTKTTRAFNDDFSGSFCSYIVFQNTSGASKTYAIVVTTFSPASPATVRLRIQRTPDPQTEETVTVGGVVKRFTGNGSAETMQTVPVRGTLGGQPVDTVLYVINPTIGGPAKFDDDSGLNLLSKIPGIFDCSGVECWVVAGNFTFGASGGNLAVWSQNAANDSDGDGISNAMEQLLISNNRLPAGADSKRDADNDGLSDYVELIGVPATSLAGGDASLAMPWQGSLGGPDPAVQDVFIEMDWMADTSSGTPHSHKPYSFLNVDYTQMFLDDSAFTGRTIRVHYDTSQDVGHWDFVSFVTCDAADLNFYTIKSNPAFFDPLRRLTHHYGIAAHAEKNLSCAAIGSTGRGEFLGNDFYVSLGGTTSGSTETQRGTHVHELGHNLFLDHNGNDGLDTGSRSCVHSSVMNYRYQTSGWTNAGVVRRAFGYSSGACLSGTGSGGCANTCVNRCVPAGQVTPKSTCPFGTGSNWFRRVSNGTCDCDRAEWTAPAGAPVANQVSLAFQDSGYAASGAPADAASEERLAEYIHGGRGRQGAMDPAHRAFADRKRAFVERQGMREGKDYSVNPENGKLYSVR